MTGDELNSKMQALLRSEGHTAGGPVCHKCYMQAVAEWSEAGLRGDCVLDRYERLIVKARDDAMQRVKEAV